jgi:preprotein translocase subunit Sss1
MESGKGIRRINKRITGRNDYMDISIIATIGFTVVGIIGVIIIFLASCSCKKK